MIEKMTEREDSKSAANYVITRVFSSKQTTSGLLKEEMARIANDNRTVDRNAAPNIYYRQ